MAVDAAVIDRIKKLLNTQGRTPDEAAQFVAKAQEIAEEYDLSLEDLETTQSAGPDIEQTTGTVYAVYGKNEEWRVSIAKVVAQTFDCWFLETDSWVQMERKTAAGHVKRSYERAHYLLGHKRDVELAGYSIDFMLHEIERLRDEYVKQRWAEVWAFADKWNYTHQRAEREWVEYEGEKHPLTARKYWVDGVVEGVSAAIREAKRSRRDANTNLNAMVVHKDAEIRDWWYVQKYGMTYDAYNAKMKAEAAEAAAKRKAENDAYIASHPNAVATTAEPKAETPSARRRREEASARRSARENATYWREYQREQARKDHSAYQAGVQTGRSIGVRPGVPGGTRQAERIDQ